MHFLNRSQFNRGILYGIHHIYKYLFERFLIVKLPFLIYEIFSTILNLRCYIEDKIYWLNPSVPNYKDISNQVYSGIYDSERCQVELRRYNLRYDNVNKYEANNFLADYKNSLMTNYSRNELIVNYFWFIFKNGSNPVRHLSANIYRIFRLFCMPEYRGNATNNHIINSYRGALFLGLITGNTIIFNYAIAGLDKWFNRLARDYSFDEGSSHYSLIFNIWVSDIYIVLLGTGLSNTDLGMYCKNFLSLNIRNMNSIIESAAPITIGDLSPDITFDFARIINRRIKAWLEKNEFASCETYFTNNLVTINCVKYNHFVCYYNSSNKNRIGYRSHHHDDDLSFILADREKCYLYDPGRFSYSSNDTLSVHQISNIGHSNVIIKESLREIQITMIESFNDYSSSHFVFEDNDRIIRLRRSIYLTNYGCKICDYYDFRFLSTWIVEYKYLINKKFARIIFNWDKLVSYINTLDVSNHVLSFDYGVHSETLVNNINRFTCNANKMHIITDILLD